MLCLQYYRIVYKCKNIAEVPSKNNANKFHEYSHITADTFLVQLLGEATYINNVFRKV